MKNPEDVKNALNLALSEIAEASVGTETYTSAEFIENRVNESSLANLGKLALVAYMMERGDFEWDETIRGLNFTRKVV